MKIMITCLQCGFKIEKDIEVEIEANRLAEALRIFQQQSKDHHHPEVKDFFKWRVGWESTPPPI